MIIEPKVRGFICTTAHPAGCAEAVKRQAEYVKNSGELTGAKKVLIVGASTGYGLATRITAAMALRASTIGVFFERPAEGKRTASAGWYNTAAFEDMANAEGLYAKSINGDAFSDAIKAETCKLIQDDLGKIDLLVYSLASPLRVHPQTGEKIRSVLKPIGAAFNNKTVDPIIGKVKQVSIEPASEIEIQDTVQVMGGEDWALWVDALKTAGVLSENFKTVAYDYIGPEITHPVYKDGTIGQAKAHLFETVAALNTSLADINGKAYLSVNKAVVTQASAAIPVVPLYISLLFKIMKAKGTHEGCIEQIYRLFKDLLFTADPSTDADGKIRIDDLEMQADIQAAIMALWPQVNSENLEELSDINGYRQDFYNLFGFRFDNIDYQADVNPDVNITSIETSEA